MIEQRSDMKTELTTEKAIAVSTDQLLAPMRDALESAKIAQTMVSNLLNAVVFLGITNAILMLALIMQAIR
jgi:hypothetical protein